MFASLLESGVRAPRKPQETHKSQATPKTQEDQNLYILTSSKKFFEDIGTRVVYGIIAKSDSITESVEDISSNKDVVLSILQKLSEEQCSPIHLRDVVEDFLVSQGI